MNFGFGFAGRLKWAGPAVRWPPRLYPAVNATDPSANFDLVLAVADFSAVFAFIHTLTQLLDGARSRLLKL